MYFIKSTLNIAIKNGEERAFANKADINPNTGKLGIRFYKREPDCILQLLLVIKQLLGLTISIIDGSGEEFILSKNSLINWSSIHGKKIPSNDSKLVAQIDEIFNEIKKAGQQNIAIKRPAIPLFKLNQKQEILKPPKRIEISATSKHDHIENLINGFQELIPKYNENINSIKEDLRRDIETLKNLSLKTSEEAPDFKLIERYLPEIKLLNAAIDWAVYKYSQEALIEMLKQKKVKNNHDLTKLVASNLSNIQHQEAKKYLKRDDPELFELAEEAKRLSSTLRAT